MHTKRRRQRLSKRKGGQGRLLSSSRRSRSSQSDLTHCNQILMNMFKKYNTSRYRSALKTVMRELLKYHPLAIIEFIEMHFNEPAILAHFNNEKCLKMHLDTLKQQLHQYKEKIGKTPPHEKFTKLTMEHASSIIKKGYDTFSKLKLRGGAPGESEEPDRCPICLNGLENGSLIIHPIRCPMHKAHSACLRSWWRRNPICPICRTPGHLPSLLPEEEPADQEPQEHLQMQPHDAENLQMQQQMQQEIQALLLETNLLLRSQRDEEEVPAEQMHRRNAGRNARLAFIIGLFGLTMGATEMTIGSFVMIYISMFLLAFLGSN